MFRELDRDSDGLLSIDEMSDTLRSERAWWDANRDGFIDRGEYLAYFQARMQTVLAEREARAGTEGPRDAERQGDSGVYRPDRLPPGLPGWFSDLDRDRDSQLGLYEWKHSGRPLADFFKMDRNEDGFLTAEELHRYVALLEQGKTGPLSGGWAWEKDEGGKGGPKGPKSMDPNKPPKEPKPKDPNKPPKEPKGKDLNKPPTGWVGVEAWGGGPEPIGYPRR
jgi:hypothetical protein